jgi:hypothetical protein
LAGEFSTHHTTTKKKKNNDWLTDVSPPFLI